MESGDPFTVGLWGSRVSLNWQIIPKPRLEIGSIEFTMRNRGAKHLRVEAHNLTWYQYHSLDVAAFLFTVVLLFILIFLKTCKFCFRKCCSRKNRKTKAE